MSPYYINLISLIIPIIVFFFRKRLSKRINITNIILFFSILLTNISYHFNEMIYATLMILNLFLALYLLLQINDNEDDNNT